MKTMGLACALALAAVAVCAQPAIGGEYEVASGDSLLRIATQFGVTVDALKAANGLSDDLIFEGEVLTIPGVATPRGEAVEAVEGEGMTLPPPLRTARSHRVRSGDSVWTIAFHHGVLVRDLLQANGIRPEDAERVEIGRELSIPAPSERSAPLADEGGLPLPGLRPVSSPGVDRAAVVASRRGSAPSTTLPASSPRRGAAGILASPRAERSFAPPTGRPSEVKLLLALNQVRIAEGRSPLRVDDSLASAARARARSVASTGRLTHVDPSGVALASVELARQGVEYQHAGEVLAGVEASGVQATVEAALRAFLASPTRRAHLLDGGYARLGVGTASAGDGRLVVVALFAD